MDEKTRRDLVKVAVLYHMRGLKQSEVAQIMGVSRSLVSKYLIDAEKAGITEVFIKSSSAYTVEMELKLEDAFGLKRAVVVDTNGLSEREAKLLFYQTAARSFTRELASAKSVGLSWGGTIRSLVDELPFSNYSDLEVIPLVGGMGPDNFAIHSNQLVQDFSRKTRSTCKFLYAPALVGDLATKKDLYANATVRDVIEAGKRVDIAFLGISSVLHGKSTMERIGYITPEELALLRSEGAVGDINSRFFSADGKEIYHVINERVIGINLADIRNLPLSVVIALQYEKREALYAALSSHIANAVVVTDKVGEYLLDTVQGRGE